MVYLKDILKCKFRKKVSNPLVIRNVSKNQHHSEELDLNKHISLYKFVLGNYDLKRTKFLNIRPHDQFILGRYWKKILEEHFEKDLGDNELWNWLLDNVYIPVFQRILINKQFIISVESNGPKFPSFIHFHLQLFNTTVKEFKFIIKEFKKEFSSINQFYYRNVFNKTVNLPDYAVKPKSYNTNEKHFASLYYMGFDKKSIGLDSLLSRKSSYFLNYYYVETQPKDYTTLNEVYRLFPYNTGCKNSKIKNI